jgi:hypothetical protein
LQKEFNNGEVMRFSTLAITGLVLLAALSGCTRNSSRTDAQVVVEVQNKLGADAKVTSHDIGIQAEGGVITLSGTVVSDDERAAAASDAATVDGVKTVVNNLVVQQAEAPSSQLPETRSEPAKEGSVKRQPVAAAINKPVMPQSAPSAGDLPSTQVAALPPPPAEPAPAQAPPSPPKKVTIPAGTQLTVRLNDVLDTEKNQVGDSFHATLGAPISMNDEVVIPSGADVVGRVVDVKSAGRFAGSSLLTLELNSLSVNGKIYNIQTSQWSRQGKGEGKNTAVKAGGGAALGAVIGAVAGGGKGAAIGSVAGAGAGTGAAATKKGEQIKLAPEATLSFLLINTVTVTEQSANNKNAGRTPLQ